eukprot:10027291-Ditylum_brightwellii.AAC.1
MCMAAGAALMYYLTSEFHMRVKTAYISYGKEGCSLVDNAVCLYASTYKFNIAGTAAHVTQRVVPLMYPKCMPCLILIGQMADAIVKTWSHAIGQDFSYSPE